MFGGGGAAPLALGAGGGLLGGLLIGDAIGENGCITSTTSSILHVTMMFE